MNSLNTAEYYLARERRERELADRASNPAVAAIHHDMAERYAQIVETVSVSRRDRDDRTSENIVPQPNNI